MNPRQYLSAREKRALLVRQNHRCKVCGEEMVFNNIAYDHHQALVFDGPSKPDRAICRVPCHRDKSIAEHKANSKAKRIERKRLGLTKPKRKMQSRGFDKRLRKLPHRPFDKRKRICKSRAHPAGEGK